MKPSTPSGDRLRAPEGAAGDPEASATVGIGPLAAAFDGPRLGESIGRYRLLQKLGEGGWGVVYLAEQEEGLWRRVALKVIKVGMDTKAVIARFEAERQALALMDHPNIAKVLDAGATEAGRPYFVMELVRGVRITDYCDQHKASTRERLELFMQVCQAIQHAHQKGIIHRDIKPSNILVTIQDGAPMPKVIDFGIAKSMHGRLTDATVFTSVDQFIGTPVYMAPEQAELSGLDVDTRCDIYSLGVVLYELLTGRTPFDPKTLATAGIDEIRRLIREVDPPPPSSRLGTLTQADISTVAKHHGSVPAQLSAQLRGDLDWIVMKALEKQRNRRYETAAALAADVGRHLNNEPVTARPPSTVYRVQKFVIRHKAGAAAAAAVALALVAGAVISTWQAVRAREAQRVAVAERAEAQRSRDRAEELMEFMLGDLRNQLEKVGRLDVLEAVDGKATAYYSSLKPRDLTDATLARQAKLLTLIGEIRMKQERTEEAMNAFTAAYERASALAARHPTDTGMLFKRGQAEFWIGVVHRKRGAIAARQEWLTRYRDTSAALLALEPTKHEWQVEVIFGSKNLAALKKDNGDLEGARADFTAVRTVLQTMVAAKPNDAQLKFSLTDTESYLGSLAERLGEFPSALAHFTAEGQGLEALMNLAPDDMKYRFQRADNWSFQARILGITGRRAEAQKCLLEARALIDVLTTHDPDNRPWAKASHFIRLREATLARANQDIARARELAGAARSGFQLVLSRDPRDRFAIRELAPALRLEADLRVALGEEGAREMLDEALRLGDEALGADPKSEDVVSQVAQTLVSLAQLAGKNDRSILQRHAERAIQLLAPNMESTKDWRIIDPAVRALALLGRRDAMILLQSRLDKLGYVPLTRWPAVSTKGP